MSTLSQTFTVQPRPQLRKRIVGYAADRTRLPFYLGVSAETRQPTYLLLPNDRSFLASILISGPSGCLYKDEKIIVFNKKNEPYEIAIKDAFELQEKGQQIYVLAKAKANLCRTPAAIVFSGEKPLYKITTETGKVIIASPDHVFFTATKNSRGHTIYSEKRVEQFTTNDNLAVFNVKHYIEKQKRAHKQMKLLNTKPSSRQKNLVAHQTDAYKEKIIIECDGNFWHNPENDKKRDIDLKDAGYAVIHFTEDDILARGENVKAVLADLLLDPPEKIISIEPFGYGETYDIKTPITENFILANGVLSHNSGKSITTRILLENFYIEWKVYGHHWRHPCTIASTLLVLDNGEILPIKNVVDGKMVGRKVLSMRSDLKVGFSEILSVHKVPSPPELIKIETRSGYRIVLTPENLVPIIYGGIVKWVRADEVKTKDFIATPRIIPPQRASCETLEFLDEKNTIIHQNDLTQDLLRIAQKVTRLPKTKIAKILGTSPQRIVSKLYCPTIWEAKKLAEIAGVPWGEIKEKIHTVAYRENQRSGRPKPITLPAFLPKDLLYLHGLVFADGWYGKVRRQRVVSFLNTEKVLTEKFRSIIESYGLHVIETKIPPKKNKLVSSKKEARHLQVFSFTLEHLFENIERKLLSLPNHLLSQWIKGVLDGDGSIVIHKTGVTVSFAMGNQHEAFLVASALLRFGIQPKISKVRRDKAIIVRIRDAVSVRKFLKEIGSSHPSKKAEIPMAFSKVSTVQPRSNLDTVPISAVMREIRKNQKLPLTYFANHGCSFSVLSGYELGKHNPTFTQLKKIASAISNTGLTSSPIHKLSTSGVRWDVVKKAKKIKAKTKYVYDLTTKNGNFFANNICMHNCIIFDSKANHLGINKPNMKARDRYLLKTIHPKWNKKLAIPNELINVYLPAYTAPTDKQSVLRVFREKWQAKDFWGVPWRHITDLAHLGTVLKVPAESLWAEELRPTFDKASADPDMTLKGLIGVGGVLHKAAKRIRNASSRSAALSFVERWRHNRYWFSNVDKLAEHLADPFSINVLTFVETPEKIYFNQLAFLIALESLMATLQESKEECQPIIIIHDVLNFIGEGKPFRNEILDALKRLLAGQARTLAHGYVVIIETQSLDLPKELGDPLKFTVHLQLSWKSQSPTLRRVSGFVGGNCSLHDHFNNFHRPSVVIRPPLSSYSV